MGMGCGEGPEGDEGIVERPLGLGVGVAFDFELLGE